jgi:hypothetical protein
MRSGVAERRWILASYEVAGLVSEIELTNLWNSQGIRKTTHAGRWQESKWATLIKLSKFYLSGRFYRGFYLDFCLMIWFTWPHAISSHYS